MASTPAFLNPGRQGDHAQDRASRQIRIGVKSQVEPQRATFIDQRKQHIGPSVVMRDVSGNAGLLRDLENLAHAQPARARP